MEIQPSREGSVQASPTLLHFGTSGFGSVQLVLPRQEWNCYLPVAHLPLSRRRPTPGAPARGHFCQGTTWDLRGTKNKTSFCHVTGLAHWRRWKTLLTSPPANLNEKRQTLPLCEEAKARRSSRIWIRVSSCFPSWTFFSRTSNFLRAASFLSSSSSPP